MKALEKIEKSNILKFIIFALMFICWLLPFVDKANYLIYEQTSQIAIGVIVFLMLILFKDTFLVLETVLLFPFIFSHSMTADALPIHLFVVVGLVVSGLIVHVLIYKQKPSKPKFLIGFVAIAISLALGGILYNFNPLNTALFAGMGVAFITLYLVLSASTKPTYKELSGLISYLGLFLILQMLVFYLLPENMDLFLKVKRLDIGWANNGNSFSIIMLACFPFTFYLGTKNKGFKSVIVYTLAILEILSIIITYSRGAVLAAVVSYILFVFISFFFKEYRKKMLWFCFAGVMTLCLVVIGLYFVDKQIINDIYKNLTKIDLNSINGRVPIYEKMLLELKEQPLFGFGMFHSFGQGGTEEIPYLWGHNTFIHSAYTLGLLGFVAMVLHHIQKYVFCFRKIRYEKIVLLFSFLATDIYGFIDVSYFFINFMIVLLIILIMSDNSLREV